MKTPVISVIMPVRNMELFSLTAVYSILSQTFNDFEFIIINDFSTDNTAVILDEIHDSRIIRINNTYYTGVYKCMNTGIDIAKGKYICIMDAYDISRPDRLMKQFDFMESNPQYIAAGSDIEIFSFNNYPYLSQKLRESERIKINLLEENACIHSTMIIRQEVFNSFGIRYNDNYHGDYEIMLNISRIGDISNIAEPLILYRKHKNRAIALDAEQLMSLNQIRLKQLEAFKIRPSIDEIILHMSLMSDNRIPESKLSALENWCNKLLTKNNKIQVYNQEYLFKFFEERFVRAIRKNKTEQASIVNPDISVKQIFNSSLQIPDNSAKDKLSVIKKGNNEASSNNYTAMTLTQKEHDFLVRQLSHCSYYLEYGSGSSTKLANISPNIKKIISVESDKIFWTEELEAIPQIKFSVNENRLLPLLVDIGKTGVSGYPVSEEKKDEWPTYSHIPYEAKFDFNYDLILIDGRFRVACALEACLNAAPNTKILIHDFVIRPYYFVVNSFLEEIDHVDTMVLFSIKPDNNNNLIRILLDKYKYIPE